MPARSASLDTAEFETFVQRVLPAAMERAGHKLVDAAAAGAKTGLEAEVRAKVDRPTKFTERAWQVAKSSRSGEPEAVVSAREIQAAYLGYLISGGVRRPGDVGARSRKHLYVARSQPLDDHGNIPKRALKRLADGAQRKGSRIFFGTVKGQENTLGWWLRPERTPANRDGKRLIRRRGVVNVKDMGGPKQILKAYRAASYRGGLIEYDRVVQSAMSGAVQSFEENLLNALRNRGVS